MTATTDYFLTIDNGTQSVRALVFDQLGNLIAKTKVDIEPYHSPQPNWAEQDANYFWQAVCKACQELWLLLPIEKNQIKAVSITSQRATMVAVDKLGKPLRPAFIWLDQRHASGKPSFNFFESLLLKVAGAKTLIYEFYGQAKSNWMSEHQPNIWQQVDKFLLLSGYHTFKMTGNFNDAIASQVGYIPFDFKHLQWAKATDWKWRLVPTVKPSMLPRLLSAGSELGQITAQAAAQTGIPEGLPLIASGSDKACEVIGSGCTDETTGSLSYGTTATFNITSPNYIEPIAFHPAYPGVIPGSYNPEMIIKRGYWMVSWFKKEFGLYEENLAKEQGIMAEVLFDDLLKAVPPGSMGLTLQPFWSSDTSGKTPEAKGAIIGFGDVHTRAHVYRAIIEGLTYALREGKEVLERRTKTKITQLKVSGGGSQSDEIMQITADIFGMRVERPHTFETSGLGAAIACAVGVGTYCNFNEAVEQMTHVGDIFEPNEKHHALYDQLYNNVYRKMYSGLRASYKMIRKITNYPN
jgi:sugar (pentulose or hexulose) kinase